MKLLQYKVAIATKVELVLDKLDRAKCQIVLLAPGAGACCQHLVYHSVHAVASRQRYLHAAEAAVRLVNALGHVIIEP